MTVSTRFPLPSRFFPLFSAKPIFSRKTGRIRASFALFLRAFRASLKPVFHRAFALPSRPSSAPPIPPIGGYTRPKGGNRHSAEVFHGGRP